MGGGTYTPPGHWNQIAADVAMQQGNSLAENTSFAQAADAAGRSRIYGGIHFEFDDAAGLQAGRALGRYVVDHLLVPGGSPL